MRSSGRLSVTLTFAAFAASLAASLSACSSKPDPIHPPGATSFHSRAPNGGGTTPMAGAGRESADSNDAPTSGGTPRAVEEGDIVKLDGTTLYVLNRYRGLQIVDLTDPAHPHLRSATPFYGAPIELYLRDQRAYVVVSDYWGWLPCIDCVQGSAQFRGSKVYIVDVANSSAPSVLSSLDIEGNITDSRIVGDVLYVVSNRMDWSWGWYGRAGVEDAAGSATAPPQNLTYVASIAIGDPANPSQVARLDFPRNGWDDHINVTSDAIFIASPAYGWWGGVDECANDQPCTKITHVDISDPNGALRLGPSLAVDGFITDRWQMDFDRSSGVLRTVLSSWLWGSTQGPLVRTFQLDAAASTLTPLGQVEIPLDHPEWTTAARFDGDKAYVVTYMQIDPLFVVDLSNPAAPAVAGSLESPGWLDYIEPRGDRLIALGHLQDPDNRWRLQVSLYDVSNASQPALLDRESFGSEWGWTPGQRDDFQKVFRVLDDQNLILVPFSSWEASSSWGWWGTLRGNVQLLDFDRDHLTARGRVRQNGYTERALTMPGNKLIALSSEIVDVLDISDRDHPALSGTLELARNITDIAVENGVAVEFVGDWYQGTTSLYVVNAAEPNATEPLGKLDFPFPGARIFRNGNFAYVVSQGAQLWPVAEDGTQATTPTQVPPRVTVIDISDPTHPHTRGSLDLPADFGAYGYYGYGYYGFYGPYWAWWNSEMTQVDGSLLAVQRSATCLEWDTINGGCANLRPNQLMMIDLSNADAPAIASEVTITGAEWTYGLTAQGRMLYLSHFETESHDSGDWWVRYYLDRVDISDPAAPVQLPKVNIPGWFVGASADNSVIYSQEYDYANHTASGWVHALSLIDNVAYLRSSTQLNGWLGQISVHGGFAYGINYQWDNTGSSTSTLVSVDLRDPDALVAAETPLSSGGYAWYGALGVAGQHAFLSSYDGLLIFGLDDPAHPAFQSFQRTHGWAGRVEVSGDNAYVPLGYSGVDTISLAATPVN